MTNLDSVALVFSYLLIEVNFSKFYINVLEMIVCAFSGFSKFSFKRIKGCHKTKIILILIVTILFTVKNGLIQQRITTLLNPKQDKTHQESISEVPLWLDDGVFLGLVSLMEESFTQTRLHFETSFEINYCSFNRMTQYLDNGGVIYIADGSYSMSLSNSMFYNCSSSGHGGAIFFNSTYSTIQRICANRCSARADANHFGHFAYLKATQINQVLFLSISFCTHIKSGECPIYLLSGSQKVDNTNSSMNNAAYNSAIGFCAPSSFTSTHCTFSNNNVSRWVCLYFFQNSGTMSYANIVSNNSPDGYGVVYLSGGGSPKLYYCVFDMNENTLFNVVNGSLEVSHSFIALTGALSVSTAVSIANNNSFSKRQTYQIQFFNSYYCNTDIPIRTIEATLGVTSQETPQRTYENCSELYHTSDLKELSAIFSFLFFSQILILLIQ